MSTSVPASQLHSEHVLQIGLSKSIECKKLINVGLIELSEPTEIYDNSLPGLNGSICSYDHKYPCPSETGTTMSLVAKCSEMGIVWASLSPSGMSDRAPDDFTPDMLIVPFTERSRLIRLDGDFNKDCSSYRK